MQVAREGSAGVARSDPNVLTREVSLGDLSLSWT